VTPRSLSFWFPRRLCGGPYLDLDTLGILLGVVLPIYPMLFVIHQKIGKYDEIVEEFKKLRTEHEKYKEKYHGT